MTQFLVWCREHKQWVIGGSIGLLSLLGMAIRYVPFLHAQTTSAYNWTKQYVVGGEVEPDLTLTPSSSPSDSPLSALSEQVKQLEEKVRLQDQEIIQSRQVAVQVDNQLKAAVAEVAKTNDLLEKRQNEWLATLKRLGVVSSTSAAGENVSVNTGSGNSPTTSSETPTQSGKVNINTATAAELDGLPGIGPAYAERIVEYRQQKGPYKTVDDLENVQGIGPSTVSKIKDLVEV